MTVSASGRGVASGHFRHSKRFEFRCVHGSKAQTDAETDLAATGRKLTRWGTR
jgi:hypothetical protein